MERKTSKSDCLWIYYFIGGLFRKVCFYGSEFIPKLNEGAIYVRATLPNSINLDESVRLTKEMKTKLQKFEEVKFILSQTGRPNDGTDPTGFSTSNSIWN